MKLTLFVLFAALALAPLGGRSQDEVLIIPANVDAETVKDVGNQAIRVLLGQLAHASQLAETNTPRRFAVLPLQRDLADGYFTTQLRNEFTSICGPAGFKLFTPRDNSDFKSLLAEIHWGQLYGDTMDPATIQKFGRFQGVDGIIRGRVGAISLVGQELKVRVNLQAFVVQTGEQIWGAEHTATHKLQRTFSTAEILRIALFSLAGLVGIITLWQVIAAIRRAKRPR